MYKRTIISCIVTACAIQLYAKVTLPQLFQDGMVLQREKSIPIWGKADAGESITVTLNKKQAKTTADANGCWRVDLPAMKAGGPYELRVMSAEGKDKSDGLLTDIVIRNVMMGDVWLCSGQSNIDVTIERVYPWYTRQIDDYENPNIRLFRVQNDTDTHGVRHDIRPTAINWKPVNKQNAWLFSAVGYFLGRRMFEETNVAQGIIVNSWGGTPIEAWISADSLKPHFPMLVEKTRLYQDDDYVRTQQKANMLMNQQWNKLLNENDPGMRETEGDNLFASLEYDDSQWPDANQWDNSWAYSSSSNAYSQKSSIIGSIWLRQHVTIDKSHAGKPARLLLGTLFDADVTYVNGKQVGTTGYQYPPRRYDLPEGLLREGDNVIAVRFINKYGTAHFIKEKDYLIAFGDDRQSLNPLPTDVIPLRETWKSHIGAQMPPCPSSDVSLQNLPTTLYNAVVHPLAPYALAGVVWYQGESNTGNPQPYEQYLTTMVNNWRALWHQPLMPFVVVQLANFMEPTEQPQHSAWAQLREAQRRVAEKMPAVELATAIDLGETVDIHPLRKRELADRIALCFSRLVFGNKKSAWSPKLMAAQLSTQAETPTVLLTFDQPLQPGVVDEYELAGSDGIFHNATAIAQGNTVTLTCPDVPHPCRVRHAWKDNPIRLNTRSANADMPAVPFEAEIMR